MGRVAEKYVFRHFLKMAKDSAARVELYCKLLCFVQYYILHLVYEIVRLYCVLLGANFS